MDRLALGRRLGALVSKSMQRSTADGCAMTTDSMISELFKTALSLAVAALLAQRIVVFWERRKKQNEMDLTALSQLHRIHAESSSPPNACSATERSMRWHFSAKLTSSFAGPFETVNGSTGRMSQSRISHRISASLTLPRFSRERSLLPSDVKRGKRSIGSVMSPRSCTPTRPSRLSRPTCVRSHRTRRGAADAGARSCRAIVTIAPRRRGEMESRR